jgi:hypothetical protein
MVNKPSQKKKRYGKQGTIKYGYIHLQAEQVWIYPIKYFIYKSTFEWIIILYTYNIYYIATVSEILLQLHGFLY